MTLDLQPIIVWITAALTVINFITIVKNMLSSTSKENAVDIALHEKKLVEHDRRIQTVEGEMRHLPDRETTHRIEMTMMQVIGRLDKMETAMDGRFSSMDERLKPITAMSERMQDALIEGAKGKTS